MAHPCAFDLRKGGPVSSWARFEPFHSIPQIPIPISSFPIPCYRVQGWGIFDRRNEEFSSGFDISLIPNFVKLTPSVSLATFRSFHSLFILEGISRAVATLTKKGWGTPSGSEKRNPSRATAAFHKSHTSLLWHLITSLFLPRAIMFLAHLPAMRYSRFLRGQLT